MSNLAITPQWHDEINQVETNEVIMGGANGNANLAPKQLAESLLWLKQQFETKKTETYKVGDVYMTTIDHADAAAVKAHHGYGTWVRYAEGRAPVGFSDNTSDIAEYKTMGNTFGENTHKLTIEAIPSHKHSPNEVFNKFAGMYGDFNNAGWNTSSTDDEENTPGSFSDDGSSESELVVKASQDTISKMLEQSAGGNQPHNNIQPSIVTGYWLRTA